MISIVWGNLAAMRQTSFRRMIAYSSIAHAGYLFYAFLGDGPGRFQAVVFYVLAYGLMNLLAFAALPHDDDDAAADRLDGLKGLFQRAPYAAVMIAIAMLSLAGIPPFPGFVAKFLIFKNVMAAGYTTYAVLGLVGSYLGIYFYLRVIQFMFMSAAEPGASPAAQRDLGDARDAAVPRRLDRARVIPGLGDRHRSDRDVQCTSAILIATDGSKMPAKGIKRGIALAKALWCERPRLPRRRAHRRDLLHIGNRDPALAGQGGRAAAPGARRSSYLKIAIHRRRQSRAFRARRWSPTPATPWQGIVEAARRPQM